MESFLKNIKSYLSLTATRPRGARARHFRRGKNGRLKRGLIPSEKTRITFDYRCQTLTTERLGKKKTARTLKKSLKSIRLRTYIFKRREKKSKKYALPSGGSKGKVNPQTKTDLKSAGPSLEAFNEGKKGVKWGVTAQRAERVGTRERSRDNPIHRETGEKISKHCIPNN